MTNLAVATDPDRHRAYECDGRHFPSVTTVIGTVLRKPELERWRGRVGNQVADRRRDEAADFGTQVHKACLLVAQGIEDIPLELPANFQAMVDGFRDWFARTIQSVISVEVPIFNTTYHYAGTPDLIAVIKNDRLPAVLDIKTSPYMGPEMPLQLAAYRGCFPNNGLAVDRRLIIQLPSDRPGKVNAQPYDNHASDFNAFLWTLSLYRWLKEAH